MVYVQDNTKKGRKAKTLENYFNSVRYSNVQDISDSGFFSNPHFPVEGQNRKNPGQ